MRPHEERAAALGGLRWLRRHACGGMGSSSHSGFYPVDTEYPFCVKVFFHVCKCYLIIFCVEVFCIFH